MAFFRTGRSLSTEPPLESDFKIALAGNPNVGKSTVFNSLTGLKQHTGNWTGKTVESAAGFFEHKGKHFAVYDLPGTYSLMSASPEEQAARDFICFEKPDLTVVVLDATCLERNLNLALQIFEITDKVLCIVNLLDEAEKKGISVDLDELSLQLGCDVIGVCARNKTTAETVKESIFECLENETCYPRRKTLYCDDVEAAVAKLQESLPSYNTGLDERWLALRLLDSDDELKRSIAACTNDDIFSLSDPYDETKHGIKDKITAGLAAHANEIFSRCVKFKKDNYAEKDRAIDRVLTSKATGIPIMLLLLGVIFWITIAGANYPSELLSRLFSYLEGVLTRFFDFLHLPAAVTDFLAGGVFKTTGWVISVMLPPMAIFFPLFTLLEDFGLLPRIAYNLDRVFKKCGGSGKQSLTMAMGFGCNACGVTGCRIIGSERERLIAMLTNCFVPCNGRFPTLISIISMFLIGTYAGMGASFLSAAVLVGVIMFGAGMSLLCSKLLSKTLLKGCPSGFSLELPPYRRPQIIKSVVRSLLDRGLFVLYRAVCVAVPAGGVIWLLANITVGDQTLLLHISEFLDPFASLFGMDGVILLAFILGFPANEIVFPIIIMAYTGVGTLTDLSSLSALRELLVSNGWTIVTAICTLSFSLIHFPCSTTLLTIKSETKSLKWTAWGFILPTAFGLAICFVLNTVLGIFI